MKTFKLTAFTLFSLFGMNAFSQTEAANKQLIRDGFDRWAAGTGSFFDLLAEDASWTISGSAALSKTYTSKQQLLDEVIVPLNELLTQKIVPTVREIYADGNTVIVIWDGKATAFNGDPYNVSYAWFMQLDKGKIVKVTAFLDTKDFDAIFEKAAKR
ncbi:nuclear transport factor 2 family protein [Fluviicola sp.]|uniref:nuclear transport factor 2 family protein n=1 Tax=Fluviicola sp. TaxID=1917219 RepID=UPI0031D110F4